MTRDRDIDLLLHAGPILYGPCWRRPLAEGWRSKETHAVLTVG